MIAFNVKKFTMMLNGMNFSAVCIDSVLTIGQQRIFLPTAFPKLVEHIKVFISHIVATVMRDLLSLSHRSRSAVEITGHNIPSGAPLGQVVKRGHPACKQIGLLVAEIGGNTKP